MRRYSAKKPQPKSRTVAYSTTATHSSKATLPSQSSPEKLEKLKGAHFSSETIAAESDVSEKNASGFATLTPSSRQSSGAHKKTRSARSESYIKLRKKRTRIKALRVLLIAFAFLLAGAVAALGCMVISLDTKLSAGIDDNLLEVLSVGDDEAQITLSDPFYILLLGVDKSEERLTEFSSFRADTIILTRVDPQNQIITMVSIPRDTAVLIDGYGLEKINAGYAYGGPALMVQLVENLAGVKISHYAEVDFEQLTTLIDNLGGIEVTIPVDVVDNEYAHIDLAAGTHVIDGTTALALARSRHAYDSYGAGDFYRAANQRMIIGAIMRKVLSLDLFSMTTTISSLANCATTDLSLTDIINLAIQFRGLDIDNNVYTGQCLTGGYYYNELWYEIVDEASWTEMMARVDAGLSPYSDESQDFTAGVAGSVGTGTNVSGDSGSIVATDLDVTVTSDQDFVETLTP